MQYKHLGARQVKLKFFLAYILSAVSVELSKQSTVEVDSHHRLKADRSEQLLW